MARGGELVVRHIKTCDDLHNSRHRKGRLQVKSFYYPVGDGTSDHFRDQSAFRFQIGRILGAACHLLACVNADDTFSNCH